MEVLANSAPDGDLLEEIGSRGSSGSRGGASGDHSASRRSPRTDPGEIGREELVAALAAASGNVAQAAAQLGVSRFAVYRLMKRYGVSG